MNEAPPRYDAGNGEPISSSPSSEVAILQAQVLELQRQVSRLSEIQRDQLSRQIVIPDPPVFNGKAWFREWHWKMTGKLEELGSLDEKIKIDYIASRLTESAFMAVELYLSRRLRPEAILISSRPVETADELMQILKKKYAG